MTMATAASATPVAEPLKGRVSLITGSTSGIGLGIARALAGAGSDVVLNGFGKPEEIERIRAGMAAEYDVEVDYSPADMARGDEVAAMVAATESRFGAVDILVNNAGIQYVAPLEQFPAEKWDAIRLNSSRPAPTATCWISPSRCVPWGVPR